MLLRSPSTLYITVMVPRPISNIFIVLRAKQWVKNLLLFLPLTASGNEITLDVIQKAIVGFLLFSSVASFGYILNDLKDRKIDALHPQKKLRVLATASFTNTQLSFIYSALLISTLSLSLAFLNSLNLQFYFILVTYFVMTNLYTFYFKTVPIIEMFLVASGFVFRVIAGGSLFGITVSSWLLLVTASSSMLLVSMKRLAEFNSSLDKGDKRVVLLKYNLQFLSAIPIIFMTISIMAYCLWAFTSVNNSTLTELSIIPFSFALMRLFLQSQKLEESGLEDVIVKDFSIVISGFILLATVYLGVAIK
jgi:decaprenyl-phosphate phosphoribosyltransferase